MSDRRARLLFDGELPVAEAIVAALDDLGVEHVLGIPGGLTGPIWRALYEHPSIRAVLVREESLASYMAEAYGRMTGAPAVVMGQGEWIVGNAGQGYLESLLGSSPMVILTEMSDGGPLSHHAVYQGGSGDYGAWDARKALEGVTKRVMVSHHPAQAVQHVQLAVKHALTGDPGPVAVVFASSSLSGTVSPRSTPRVFAGSGYLRRTTGAVDPTQVAAVANLLLDASRPVVVAGNGVRLARASDELERFAEAYDVPVVTTAQGKGVFAEDHPLAGGVIGAFGWPSANDLLADSDLVLAIGTKLGTMDTIDETSALLDPTRQTILQVDVEPLNLGWTTPLHDAIVADAGSFLRHLLDRPHLEHRERRAPTASEARVAKSLERHQPVRASTGPTAPFSPTDVIAALDEALPSDVVVTCDAGENRLFMMRWFRTKRGGRYLQPASGGGMGHAIPAAMGARLADPRCSAVAVCGDGGFAMSIHGLMTAVEQQLPIGVIVLNNGALGWVLHGMGERAVASRFQTFDHAAIARAIGCEGYQPTTTSELRSALERLTHPRVPVVIDVPTSLDTSFRDILDPLDQRRAASGY